MALSEVLHARHLAGRGLNGASISGAGASGRRAPVVAALGDGAAGSALVGALFLAGLTGLGLALRSYHPQPGPLAKWLPAFFVALGLASWCHLQTLFTMECVGGGVFTGWAGGAG